MKCTYCGKDHGRTLTHCKSAMMREKIGAMGIETNKQYICGLCAVEDDIFYAAEKAARDMNREREHLVLKPVTATVEFPVPGIEDIETIANALRGIYHVEPFTSIKVEIVGIERSILDHEKRCNELYGK